MSRCLARALALAALTSQAVAAQPGLSEDYYLAELPMVLTVSRLVQSPLDAPAAVTVIDREMIRASGMVEIHDLLRLAPGFLVADWPYGSPNVINHGLGDASSGRLQVLIDGHSVYNPFNGHVEWQELPIRVEDIERIEVVRGQNAAAYGANAFQGVVNIITRSPQTESGHAVTLRSGTPDQREYAARLNGRLGSLDWRISLSERRATNFRDLGVVGYYGGEAIRYRVLNSQGDLRLNARDQLHFQVGLSQGDDRVSAIDDNVLPHPRRQHSRLLQAAWRRTYAPDSEVSLQYFHYHRSSAERYLDQTYSSPSLPVAVDLGMKMQRDDLEFQQQHAFAAGLQGLWGVVLRQESVASAHYLYDQGKVGGFHWQAFGNLSWAFAPRWTVNLGGMLERHYFTDTLFSPRLALHFSPGDNQTLRLSAGRAYRAPTIMNARSLEVYPYEGGIADVGYISPYALKPERVDSLELGYVAHVPSWGLNLDARLFTDRYGDYIDDRACTWDASATNPSDPLALQLCGRPRPAGYEHYLAARVSKNPINGRIYGSHKAYEFYNLEGEARIDGLQLRLDWRQPWLGRLLLGQTFSHIRVDAMALARERDLDRSVPARTSSVLWLRELPEDITASVGAYFVDDMKWLNDGDDQPAYWRYDLRLARRLGRRGEDNELALTFQNLAGKYPEFKWPSHVAQRRVFLTLHLEW